MMRTMWFVANVGIEGLNKSGNVDMLFSESLVDSFGGEEISKNL